MIESRKEFEESINCSDSYSYHYRLAPQLTPTVKSRLCLIAFIFVLVLVVAHADVSKAQNYPVRPIRIITTTAATGTDHVARLLAKELTVSLGQQVIVDNRGIAGVEAVAKAPRDGYTLLMYTGSMWLLPFMRDKVPWDPVKDFTPVSLTNQQPHVLVINPSVPANSVSELIALAKAKPGTLNYGSGSPGAPYHLAAELFNAMAGVKITRVSYKGAGQAMIALVSGEVQLTFSVPAAYMPHAKAGKLKALAVTSAEPTPLAPGLPTVTASGLPGYEFSSLAGMFAPAGTPETIVNLLNRETVRILNNADLKQQLLKVGLEAVSSSPPQFEAILKADMAKWGKVIRDAGIHE